MTTIQQSLINTGAVVKDSPGTNAIDLIYQTNAVPTPMGDGLKSPVVVQNPLVGPSVEIANNNAIVSTPAGGNGVLLVAGGLAALLLLSKDGQSAVNGIAGIGKKKKDKSLLPLLLIGGVAAWYLWPKNENAANTQITTAPVDTSDYPTGGVLTVLPAPAIFAPVEVATIARGYTAQTDEMALQRDWPAMQSAVAVMTDAEVLSMYNYFYSYVLTNQKLYRLPGATGIFPDGNYNTALYDAIAAIRVKYNLNI